MALGRKTGGRTKGVPNKVTTRAREAFLAVFERVQPDLEAWIRATAQDDPGKAADLVIRMAEYHAPKLGRTETELSGPGGGPLVVEVVTLADGKD